MPTDLTRLIEAINRVGIQNVSLLSRMTGMPTETIRYTMKKRFPNLGLTVRTPLNHSALGLERYFITLQLSKSAAKSGATILEALASNAFMNYRCQAPVERRLLTYFSVPALLADEFRAFLDTLVRDDVLADYTCERLEWSRHPELRSEYYDFGKGEWSIDWEKVKRHREAPPAPNENKEPSISPEIDSIDTLIIKELETDSWRNIAEIARKLKLNERTVRWHYRKHVADIAQSSFVNWIPVTPNDFRKSIGLIHEFGSISKERLAKLRLIFNNFPFAWYEAGRKDGYYQVNSAFPADYFMDSLRYLNAGLGDIVDSWKTWTVDLSTSYAYTIQYQNFDDKNGWFFNKDAALKAVLPQKLKIK
ncbi:MAG TPA: hypothetical protein VND40_01520 [Nitrososphaerales archaeon]|nr:hypothetical protein [Nitrososphaerales archaeon]